VRISEPGLSLSILRARFVPFVAASLGTTLSPTSLSPNMECSLPSSFFFLLGTIHQAKIELPIERFLLDSPSFIRLKFQT